MVVCQHYMGTHIQSRAECRKRRTRYNEAAHLSHCCLRMQAGHALLQTVAAQWTLSTSWRSDGLGRCLPCSSNVPGWCPAAHSRCLWRSGCPAVICRLRCRVAVPVTSHNFRPCVMQSHANEQPRLLLLGWL